MARLSRYTQTVFGSSAGLNQIAKYGSLAASAPQLYSGSTITPAIVQALANYVDGWFSAVEGQNSPAIEDINALFYNDSYQLAYLLQTGVAEWDSGTTYYTNNIVNYNGILYISLINTNLNNIPSSSPSDWSILIQSTFKAPTITKYLTTGTTAGYLFTVSSANATVGAIYTNNGNSYTVLGTISSGTQLFCSGASAPTSSGTLTKSTGTGDSTITFSANVALSTYTPPAGVLSLEIKMVGGGGGGGGGGNASGGNGGTGGLSCFGTNFLFSNGGGGGNGAANNSNGGVGGTATLGTAIGTALTGGSGGSGMNDNTLALQAIGGMGSATPLGGAGGNSGNGQSTGYSAASNTGSGGGGGIGATTNTEGGGGGGAAGWIDAIVTTINSIYYYCIGSGGTAGTAGTSGFAGGAGGSGIIVITERYQ